MRANGPFTLRCWGAALAAIASLTAASLAEDAPVTAQIIAPDDQVAFELQYSVQPGERLLVPCETVDGAGDDASTDLIQQASFWTPLTANAADATQSTEADDNDSPDAATGLFNPLSTEESTHWSTTLDTAAENRVDAAIRAAGMAIVLLGVTLVVFLGWHRLRNSKLPVMEHASQLSERGRLPITQTCRLHLVRAGNCDVLVAVDRGTVKAMTPLPAEFSPLTTSSFDSLADLPHQ